MSGHAAVVPRSLPRVTVTRAVCCTSGQLALTPVWCSCACWHSLQIDLHNDQSYLPLIAHHRALRACLREASLISCIKACMFTEKQLCALVRTPNDTSYPDDSQHSCPYVAERKHTFCSFASHTHNPRRPTVSPSRHPPQPSLQCPCPRARLSSAGMLSKSIQDCTVERRQFMHAWRVHPQPCNTAA